MTEPVVLLDVDGPVATITLNRPASRNAISGELLTRLGEAMAVVEADDKVLVAILTGADPAFCAGVDLKELGQGTSVLRGAAAGGTGPWAPVSKPVIAAVNGAAVTGGLELVLNCDIVICSDRAVFADTHARVGVLPGWGLSVLLPLAVGRSRARQMSFTGDFPRPPRRSPPGWSARWYRTRTCSAGPVRSPSPSRATTRAPCRPCSPPTARSRPRWWAAASPSRNARPGPGANPAWTSRRPGAVVPR
jgi:hypothetical protein